MTPAQCRSARSLLGLTQSELARAAGLGLSTVVDFEKERRQVSQQAISAIRIALEQAGITFIQANGGGEGVRLRSAARPTK
jgi:transcriptional regulator with XRE-family HTH domain